MLLLQRYHKIVRLVSKSSRFATARQGRIQAGWSGKLLFPSGHGNRPRVTEWILAAYFAYTGTLAIILSGLDYGLRIRVAVASLAALGILHCMGRFPRAWFPGPTRNLLPIGGVLLAYRQIGWFARPQEGRLLEQAWVRWDQLILAEWGLTGVIDATGALLPALMEFCYLLTYAVGPAGLLILAACGCIGRADRYLALYAGSAVAAYALYPYFPSEPPRTIFPGELASEVDTVFRRINWWILGHGGIHTSVFPSGHVSSAFGSAFGLLLSLPERRMFGASMTVLAAAIAVATVYGRYHYAVDAVAGLAVSCIVWMVCGQVFRIRDSSRRRDPAA